MDEGRDACVKPARGLIVDDRPATPSVDGISGIRQERPTVLARVGKVAPDFEANAFIEGGFRNVKLSDYRGQWVVLCFYPGDFTFV